MTVKEFVDKYLKIEFIKEEGMWGMHPAFMHIEHPKREDFNEEMYANGVEEYYLMVNLTMRVNPSVVYLALDYPAGGDIKNDFVVIFFVLNGVADCFAIPYNNKTGEIYPDIFPHDYRQLEEILIQFKQLSKTK